jgi:hypothetical protein
VVQHTGEIDPANPIEEHRAFGSVLEARNHRFDLSVSRSLSAPLRAQVGGTEQTGNLPVPVPDPTYLPAGRCSSSQRHRTGQSSPLSGLAVARPLPSVLTGQALGWYRAVRSWLGVHCQSGPVALPSGARSFHARWPPPKLRQVPTALSHEGSMTGSPLSPEDVA